MTAPPRHRALLIASLAAAASTSFAAEPQFCDATEEAGIDVSRRQASATGATPPAGPPVTSTATDGRTSSSSAEGAGTSPTDCS